MTAKMDDQVLRAAVGLAMEADGNVRVDAKTWRAALLTLPIDFYFYKGVAWKLVAKHVGPGVYEIHRERWQA